MEQLEIDFNRLTDEQLIAIKEWFYSLRVREYTLNPDVRQNPFLRS